MIVTGRARESRGWEALHVLSRQEMHVVPSSDTVDHVLRRDCPCEPVRSRDGAQVLLTHNSWDGRESANARPRRRC